MLSLDNREQLITEKGLDIQRVNMSREMSDNWRKWMLGAY